MTNRESPDLAKFREALTYADLPNPDFIATTVDGDSFSPLWVDLDVINLTWAIDGNGRSIVSLYDGKTVAKLIESAKQAAKATGPAWHDAPTEPGLWCSSVWNARYFSDRNIADFYGYAKSPRWYGPIPEDK